MRNRERLINQTNKNSGCLQEAHSGEKKKTEPNKKQNPQIQYPSC